MVKVGDKVRVTTDTYGPRHPKGTLGTVIHVWSGRDIVMADGGGRERHISYGEYEPIHADKPDPRDDPSNPDKLPLFKMSDRVTAMIVRNEFGLRDRRDRSDSGRWEVDKSAGVFTSTIYRLRPRTVRIEYDCDENGKPIMETGREVG